MTRMTCPCFSVLSYVIRFLSLTRFISLNINYLNTKFKTLSYLSKGLGKLANNTVTSQVLIPNKGQILDKTCSILAQLGN